MIFDKNQENFPSEFCRDIWWWAVGICPPEVSLTDEVKSQCTTEILEGCHQWHDYFHKLCADMYSNEELYQPATPRQYRDILEKIAELGTPQGDGIILDPDVWCAFTDKINRSKAYRTSGITLDACIAVLGRAGLRFQKNMAFFEEYPKIFYAMHQFQQSPNVRETPARHQFAHCDFRRLFKNYAENYDELLRRVSDESLQTAHDIHDYCKSIKVPRNIHFGIIKYKHKKHRVLDFTLHKDKYPTLQVNISTFDGEKINIPAKNENLNHICELITARKAEIDREVQ